MLNFILIFIWGFCCGGALTALALLRHFYRNGRPGLFRHLRNRFYWWHQRRRERKQYRIAEKTWLTLMAYYRPEQFAKVEGQPFEAVRSDMALGGEYGSAKHARLARRHGLLVRVGTVGYRTADGRKRYTVLSKLTPRGRELVARIIWKNAEKRREVLR